VRTRTFVILGVLVALVVAGGASYYASTHPDGLQYVAERTGFAQTAEESPTAESPLSGYQLRGVENDALSGGLAGVLGALVVLVLAGGVAYAVRRKGSADDAPTHADGPTPEPTDREQG